MGRIGFLMLLGIFFSLVGVYFCWLYLPLDAENCSMPGASVHIIPVPFATLLLRPRYNKLHFEQKLQATDLVQQTINDSGVYSIISELQPIQ